MTARSRSGRRSQRRLGKEYQTGLQSPQLKAVPLLKRGRLARIVAVLLLLLFGYGVYSVFTSSAFFIYEPDVTIKGNIVVPASEIYQASGLEQMSIFWVNPASVSERIEALPNIKAAAVSTRLPAHVSITVEERLPALIWQTGHQTWWVDAEGTIILPRGSLPDALTVVDTDGKPVELGQRLDTDILVTVRELHQLLPELSVMQYARETGIGFTTPDGWPVYLGVGDQDVQAKLTVLVSLRRELLAQGIEPQFINVQYVESPYYR